MIVCFVTILELLKVIRETENDDLTGVMQKLISTYGEQEQVANIAVDIARDLVSCAAVRQLFAATLLKTW